MNVVFGTGSNEVKQQTFPIFIEKTTAGLSGAKSLISSHMTARSSANFFCAAAGAGCRVFWAKINWAKKKFEHKMTKMVYFNFMILFSYESPAKSNQLMIVSENHIIARKNMRRIV